MSRGMEINHERKCDYTSIYLLCKTYISNNSNCFGKYFQIPGFKYEHTS